MGKRVKKHNNAQKKTKPSRQVPFVSVCTPTFNRRPFIKNMFKCFLNQTYPKSRMEWIIIDDGTDKIEDLVEEANIPQIKYFKYDTKMTLGVKRNLMHDKSSGSILVYMDDDDYYPPDRVSHSVDKLVSTPSALCAGSSIIHVHFKHNNKIVEFGPYGEKHATAGTFAFKRELLEQTRYDESAAIAEERSFLKNYTIPFVQLDPRKTILVFSHRHNTFDKKTLIEGIADDKINYISSTVSDFIKEEDVYKFFIHEIDDMLANYDPGMLKHKPDVVKQTQEIMERRKNLVEQQKILNKRLMYTDPKTSENRELSVGEVVHLYEQSQEKIKQMESGPHICVTDNVTKKQRIATGTELIDIFKNTQTHVSQLTDRIQQLEHENKRLMGQLNTSNRYV